MIDKISDDTYFEFIVILQKYLPEIRYYKPDFVKRRVLYVMRKMGFRSWNDFKSQVELDSKFVDTFLYNFSVSIDEFFRDIDVWNYVYRTILPKLDKQKNTVFWIPEITSGEELFSLCILLHNAGKLHDVKIYAGCKSKQQIEKINRCTFPIQNELLFQQNYNALQLPNSCLDYYTKNKLSIQFNSSLLNNVQFVHSHSVLSQHPQNVFFIFYRNLFLYLNDESKHNYLTHLYNKLEYGGYLALGLKEGKYMYEFDTLFKTERSVERIFRKK